MEKCPIHHVGKGCGMKQWVIIVGVAIFVGCSCYLGFTYPELTEAQLFLRIMEIV